MKKYLPVLIIVIAALSAGAYIYLKSNKPIDIAETYTLFAAEKADVFKKVTAPGNVGVKDTHYIYVETAQTVEKINVKEGDVVQIGDVLVTYDNKSVRADLERALQKARLSADIEGLTLESIKEPAGGSELLQYDSEITAAEKNVENSESDILSLEIKITQQQLITNDAKDSFERNETLYANGAISKFELDSSQTRYLNETESLNDLQLAKETAKRALELRKTQYNDAVTRRENAMDKLSSPSAANQYGRQKNAVDLSKLQIADIESEMNKLTDMTVSPVYGVVETIYATEGGVVTKSAPVMQLLDLSGIVVKADVSEYDAPMLQIGQQVDITTSGLPSKVYAGTISKIAAHSIEKEKTSGTEVVVPVEITIDNFDDSLKIGYSVDLDIYTEKAAGVVTIPPNAVVYEDGATYAFVLKDGAAVKTAVELGLYGTKIIEVKSGLNEGDIVIIEPEGL